PEQQHPPDVVAEPGTPVVEPEPLPAPEPVVAAQPEPTPAPQPAVEPSPTSAAMDDAPATAEIAVTAEVSKAVEAAPAPITEVATVATSSPTDEGQSRIFGVGDDQFRIEVKALKNSWIQVRDDVANTLILTRLLRVGDIYRVPDRAGLKLLTGNAGALEILVDGNKVPAIGTSGDVRRSVALDPDRLVQGQAVE
ncbi:MAG TPA: DUF4115 domain-containing protein, partial [Rhodospirillales bacterium]|nr:DUF4115 domain-containing protein [Rhodospirillales bacterium]